MGIFAHGNGNQAQTQYLSGDDYPIGYDAHHGIAIISSSVIEHAEEALNNGGGNDNPNTGGIIIAEHSHFMNNRRSAAFYKYHNITGAALHPDVSKFKNNRFDTNDDTRIPFHCHISMWGTRGIRIKENIFNNTNTLSNTVPNHLWAIYSLDAGYDFQQNEVNGFYKGIESGYFVYGTGNLYPVFIKSNFFDKNEISVHLSNTNYATLLGNSINIGYKQTYGANPYYSLGVKMEHSGKFTYKENSHINLYGTSSGAPYIYTAGTELQNTGDNDNIVEVNYYKDLLIGNDGDYNCANASGNIGLRYICNTNISNKAYDFIFQGPARIRNILDGWNALYTADNVYSAGSNVPHWHHAAGGNGPVKLYWMPGTNKEPVTLIYNVNKQLANFGTVCGDNMLMMHNLSNIDTGRYDLVTSENIDTLKSIFYNSLTSYNTHEYLYRQLLDGGSTPDLVDEIRNSTIEEQLYTRETFLAMSPYVSTTSLMELAHNNIVSNAILLEIFLANPDATNNSSLIDYIALEKINPMPAYMTDLIKASWDTINTPRTLLEANIGFHHTNMTVSANNLTYIYTMSDAFRNNDSAVAWMQKVGSIRNTYEKIEYYLYAGDSTNSMNMLDSIGYYYTMDSQDSAEYNAYKNLYMFKKGLLYDTIEINQLDSSQIAALKAIADDEAYTFPRSMARSALCFFYQICYPDTVRNLPATSMRFKPVKEKTALASEVTLYPNPANEYVVCFYKFTDPSYKATTLIVSDITGKPIYQANISGNSGQHIWDTRNVATGNYIYAVTTSNGLKYSGKISVQK